MALSPDDLHSAEMGRTTLGQESGGRESTSQAEVKGSGHLSGADSGPGGCRGSALPGSQNLIRQTERRRGWMADVASDGAWGGDRWAGPSQETLSTRMMLV